MAIKREHMIERQGKAFVLYAGLLAEAHENGLKGIRTHLLQVPSVDNGQVAIVFAEVTTERGVFTGLGDATPANVARMMVPHLIRLAETRAKARALRDAVNVGTCSVEELGPDADEHEHRAPVTTPAVKIAPTAARPVVATNGVTRQPVAAMRPTYGGASR